MMGQIERFVKDYERGKLSRRELVTHVAGLAAAVATAGAGGRAFGDSHKGGSTFKATGVNHIALSVPDVAKSRDFYVKHLGMTVSHDNRNSCFMTCGNNFVALFRAEEPGMNHYCYSVEDYDVSDAEEKLEAEGLNPRREGNRIYFPDPDGLEVQLASDDHSA